MPEACEARKDDLAAMALGESLGSREPALRAHLSTCADCRAYLSMMARTIGAVRGLPRPEPPRDLVAHILAAAREAESGALHATEPAAGESWLQRVVAAVLLAFRRPALASAFAAVVVASAAVALLVWSSPAGKPGETPDSDKALVARGEAPRAPAVTSMRAPEAKDERQNNVERSLPAEGAPPPAATPGPGLTAGPSEGKIATFAQAPADETPIMAVVTATPPAGAASSDDSAPSDLTRLALAQPAPAPDRPTQIAGREQSQVETAEARAGEDQTVDGEPARRFVRGVEITAEVAARDAAEGRDRAAGAAGQPADERNDREEQAALAQDGAVSLPRAATRVTVTEEGEPQAGGTHGYYADEYRAPQPQRPAIVAAAPPPPPPSAPAAPAMPASPPPPASAPAQGWQMSTPPAEAPQGGEAYPTVLESDVAGNGVGGMGGAPAAQGAVSSLTVTGGTEQGRTGGDQVAEARERLATGEPAEAEALLEDALRTQESRSADVTFLLAETYARQGKWSAAARTYDLFLARYLDDPRANEARWRAADAYRRTGAVTRAAALLQQLVGVPSYDSRARASLDEIAVETAAESTAGPVVDTGAAAAPPASAETPAETQSAPASIH